MQLNRFDLNLLTALDALLREKNVTRAAERVYVSQPAMSAALQKLRDYFDDPLLVRVGREMELTPRGLALVEPVREALLRIQVTLGTQPTFDPATVKRSFVAIVGDVAAPLVMPRVLARLAREAPGIQCHVEPVLQNSLSRLEYGEADLCLSIDSPRLFALRAYPESLRIAELRPVSWTCIVAKDHPTVGDTLSAAEFLSLPHILPRPAGAIESPEEAARRLFNVEVEVRATAHSLMELPFMLAGTPLVATLPERLAHLIAPLAPVKLFPVPIEMPSRRELLFWHKRNEPDPGHAWFRNLFIEFEREP
jgi:LysR family nod box-dependent transcriptional activator